MLTSVHIIFRPFWTSGGPGRMCQHGQTEETMKNLTSPLVYLSHGGPGTQLSGPNKVFYNCSILPFGCLAQAVESTRSIQTASNMARNVQHRTYYKIGQHRLKSGNYFRRCGVPNMSALTNISTSAQILVKDSYVIKSSTISHILFVIKSVLWLVSNG